MVWIGYVSWVLGPLLESILLVIMVREKLRAAFPRFFAYIVFQIANTTVLFVIYHWAPSNYFDAYWAGNALSVILSAAVIDEVWRRLFEQYENIRGLGSILFRWACIVMVLIAILSAINTQQSNSDRVVAAVLGFDRGVRIMQCGLFFLVVFLCRYLQHFSRQRIFGIALGFGSFATIELIGVSILALGGGGHLATVSLIQSIAYNATLLLWIVYLAKTVPETSLVRSFHKVRDWSPDLITEPSVAGPDSFLTMVEGAVERVLSRTSPWPRPATQGARMISRKPTAEDFN